MLLVAADPAAAVEEALERADKDQDDLEACCAQLAAGLDPTGAQEADLREALSRRDAALQALGRAVLLWVRQGGRLVLEDATSDDTPMTQPLAEVVAPSGEDPLPSTEPEPDRVPAPDAPQPPGAISEPTAPPRTPAIPTTPPSPESLLALRGQGLMVRWQQEEPPPPERLERLLAELGEPGPLENVQQACAQMERLLACNPHTWDGLSRDTQWALCSLLVAWGRYLQERFLDDNEEIKKLFVRLTAFQRTERTGYVHGLSRAHRPDRGSWLEDACAYLRDLRPEPAPRPQSERNPQKALERLEEAIQAGERDLRRATEACLDEGVAESDPRLLRLLAPHLEEGLEPAPRLKKLRKLLREWLDQESATEALADPWPYAARTAGWRVCLVGGDRKAELRDRLQEAFSFAEVTWETGHQQRRVESLRQRIEDRQLDLCLLVTSFISHRVAEPLVEACKTAEVPFLTLGRGNGISQIRDALEAMLATNDAVAEQR